MLHGFPQTGAMWHRLAPTLAERFSVVIPDLRGYGWSSAPASHGGEGYTKRAMGEDVVAVMEALGHARFALAGHDRGARVGYRLALDHPGRLTHLALLDIVPTVSVWRSIEAGSGEAPHWPFLAEPEPQPEQVIKADPRTYYEGLIKKWSGDQALASFDPRALQHYRAAWGDPSRIHAHCEDYRAGAAQDRAADEDDLQAGRTIACPAYLVASLDYLSHKAAETPLDVWHGTFAPEMTGITVPSGHFVAEQAPDDVMRGLESFFVG